MKRAVSVEGNEGKEGKEGGSSHTPRTTQNCWMEVTIDKEKEVYDLLLLLEGGNMKPLMKEKEMVISMGTGKPLRVSIRRERLNCMPCEICVVHRSRRR